MRETTLRRKGVNFYDALLAKQKTRLNYTLRTSLGINLQTLRGRHGMQKYTAFEEKCRSELTWKIIGRIRGPQMGG